MPSSLLDHVADRWPPDARTALPLVVREVLRAIAPHVGPDSWKALARAVGEATLSEAELEPAMIATLYESVADASGVASNMAVELTQMTLLALGGMLEPDARHRLATELPPPWRGMLEHARASTSADELVPPVADHTLASGHAGAHRPLSSSSPPAPEPARTLASTTGPVPPRRTLAGAGRDPR